jgi:tripartite-type tricarboxylate transporter receptor subunit TctC
MSRDHQFNFRRRQALGMLGALALAPAAMAADAFPSRPLRYILPFSAGSSTDFVSRLVCEHLGKQLGQAVVVDNKPGAAGVIGTQQIARANPDGYTIGLVSLATLAMVPPTMKEPPYDSVRDFAPLSAMISTDMFLIAGPRAQGRTLAEFVAWARQQKQPLFLGTLGAGTSGHFTGFLFGQAAKIKFEPVHFRTFSDLLPAMVSGGVDVMVVAPTQMEGFMKEGKLRGLAMNGPTRLPAFPDVPTFKEVGYPDMQFLNWIGVVAPAKTPADILDKLSAELIKTTTSPQVRAKLEQSGFRVIANTREEFAGLIRKDVVVWRDMVKNTGFQV